MNELLAKELEINFSYPTIGYNKRIGFIPRVFSGGPIY